MADLETQRLENLRQKQKLLAELNLHSSTVTRDSARSKPRSHDRPPPAQKRKLEIPSAPARTSARIASSGTRPSYRDDGGERYNYSERNVRTKKTNSNAKRERGKSEDEEIQNDLRSLVPTVDAEEIRKGWSQWTPTASPPRRDEQGTFHFEDYPTFIPNKSPEEVLREGCFGGSYFRPLKSRKLGIVVDDDWKELPGSWYHGLDVDRFMTSPIYNADANKFKVACGQSIEEWEANGWIAYDYDIRGWFQWYCRFYEGRRCADDERQVSRWRKCVGPTGRWKRMLLKKYLQLRVRDVFDDGGDEEAKEVSPVMHQTCHHWAYEVRQHDLDDAWAGT